MKEIIVMYTTKDGAIDSITAYSSLDAWKKDMLASKAVKQEKLIIDAIKRATRPEDAVLIADHYCLRVIKCDLL